MLDNACMTIAPRRHQHPVRHVPAVVEDRVPRERGHVTIRFVHDQIGRGKVPVAALAAGEGRIQRCPARRGTAAAPANRSGGAGVISAGDRLSRSTSGFGPATCEKSMSVPDVARIGTPLRAAPCPRAAKKNSSLTGANTAASTGVASSTSATLTHQSSRPAR